MSPLYICLLPFILLLSQPPPVFTPNFPSPADLLLPSLNFLSTSFYLSSSFSFSLFPPFFHLILFPVLPSSFPLFLFLSSHFISPLCFYCFLSFRLSAFLISFTPSFLILIYSCFLFDFFLSSFCSFVSLPLCSLPCSSSSCETVSETLRMHHVIFKRTHRWIVSATCVWSKNKLTIVDYAK